MSVIDRRILGPIDGLLTLATGCATQDFGGLNVILCGDYGQLPPVKECRCFDAKSLRYLSGPRKG
eukprot:4233905-Pleurochrysis_carterae.AAC.1